jgi:hypothetical protein
MPYSTLLMISPTPKENRLAKAEKKKGRFISLA